MNEVIALEARWNGSNVEQRQEMLLRAGVNRPGASFLMASRTWKQLSKDVQKLLKRQARQ